MTESIEKKIAKNPEVVEKATRRRFTTEYKERIATEAEQCSKPGELGSLLRREGFVFIDRPALASSTSGIFNVAIEKANTYGITVSRDCSFETGKRTAD